MTWAITNCRKCTFFLCVLAVRMYTLYGGLHGSVPQGRGKHYHEGPGPLL